MKDKIKPVEIFYADDDMIDRMIFQLVLREVSTPIHLKMAKDGEQTIEMLTNSDGYEPDIIFLDVRMPHKDGIECLREIRMQEKYKLTPVVMFSGSSRDASVKKAY